MFLFIGGLMLLDSRGVSFARMDETGVILLLAASFAGTAVIGPILDDDGGPFKPNKDAVDVLGAVAQTESRFSPYPATIADNPLAPAPGTFPFSILFDLTRHF